MKSDPTDSGDSLGCATPPLSQLRESGGVLLGLLSAALSFGSMAPSAVLPKHSVPRTLVP